MKFRECVASIHKHVVNIHELSANVHNYKLYVVNHGTLGESPCANILLVLS